VPTGEKPSVDKPLQGNSTEGKLEELWEWVWKPLVNLGKTPAGPLTKPHKGKWR